MPVFVILTPSYLIFPTTQSNISKPACMNLKISSSQCWGVNWQIPSWRNTFRLRLVLIDSLSGLKWLVLNSQFCIPLLFFHPTIDCPLLIFILFYLFIYFGHCVFDTYPFPSRHSPCGLGWNITVEKQLFNASVSQGTCNKGWLAKWFWGKRIVLVACKPIQGRFGPSKQQSLNNDLLQWAWKLPQLVSFITHQPQQTAFCFILSFHSLAFLLVPIRVRPLIRLVAIQRLDWQVPSNKGGCVEGVSFWLLWM